MNALAAVFKRELLSYFATPLAYVFIVVFLFAAGLLTFYWGGWFEGRTASLERFFLFHPWLYLILVPAIAMRLWAEEFKTGTIELLMTLPLPVWSLVLGKFLAAWVFTGVALLLTFPMWLTAAYLGDPDHGVILAGYIGSFLMAGSYLSIGACLSATTNNQVIAFVLSVVLSFLLTVSGLPVVTGMLGGIMPAALASALASFSFMGHFDSIAKGVIDLRDVLFFATVMGGFLMINGILIDQRRTG